MFFRRQQLEQSVYCEAESRRSASEDERQDVQSGGNQQEKIKVRTEILINSMSLMNKICSSVAEYHARFIRIVGKSAVFASR